MPPPGPPLALLCVPAAEVSKAHVVRITCPSDGGDADAADHHNQWLGDGCPSEFIQQDAGYPAHAKCRCISASISELGLIEPLVIYPQRNSEGSFMLLDGHVRLTILRELGWESCKCLIAMDDEAFTYNHKVNRLNPIQEHFMIRRAIKGGLSPEDIAKSLNVDVARICQKRDLLDGICPEAVELLKERRAIAGTLRELRKVAPMRQIEIAELMCASHNFSHNYAKCLVTTTPSDQFVEGERARDTHGLTPDEISRMEHEMALLGREFKVLEESHGRNVLNLVVVIGYLKLLLDSARRATSITSAS